MASLPDPSSGDQTVHVVGNTILLPRVSSGGAKGAPPTRRFTNLARPARRATSGRQYSCAQPGAAQLAGVVLCRASIVVLVGYATGSRF